MDQEAVEILWVKDDGGLGFSGSRRGTKNFRQTLSRPQEWLTDISCEWDKGKIITEIKAQLEHSEGGLAVY